MTRRRLVTAVTAACALLTLAACSGPGGGGGAQQSAGNIKDWGQPKGQVEFWDTNADPRLTEEWKKLIADFEKAHTDIKVKYVGLPNSSYLEKVDNAVASGQTPDVMLIGNDVAGFIAQNALAPLDDAYKSSGLTSQIESSMLDHERSISPDKKVYDAPLTALSDVIWYRTDWLRKAGKPAPTSYDELIADANTLTDKKTNKFGWAFRGGKGSSAPTFAMTYGMSGVDQFFTDDGKCTLDDPANVEAFKKYISLYGTDSASADISNDFPKMVAEFDGGSAFAMHHNLGSYQDHVDALGADNLAGVQPFPSAKGTIVPTSPAISGLALFAKSQHKAAAWEFVKYMSTDANSAWAQTVGQLPANKDAQKDAWIKQSQPLQDIVKTAENPQTHYLELPTYLPDYSSIIKTQMEPDFQSVLQKKMTPEDFLSKYAKRFADALAEYKQHSK